MNTTDEMKWPKLPSYLVTAIVVILSTLATTYVTQQVNTHLDEQQTKVIESLDERLRVIELSRFTEADFDRTVKSMQRQVDRLESRMERVERQ